MADAFTSKAIGDAPKDARNQTIHVLALSATKTADALIDPKLVLSWLINALGAPGYLTGVLVPIREAGALLPQPLVARVARKREGRKQFWALAAGAQGLAALSIGVFALTTDGAVAGFGIVASLLVLALARSVASTTYKDALARTVDQGQRGKVTGLAGGIAAAAALAYGATMAFGVFGDVTVAVVAAFILLACVLMLGAGVMFMGLSERPKKGESAKLVSWSDYLTPLRKDAQFRQFITARAFLTATALAPPFLIALTHSEGASLTSLGPLVIASAAAATLSAPLWGRVSDVSSQLSLAVGGFAAAAAYATAAVIGWGEETQVSLIWASGIMFLGQVGYNGVRSGRAIYLTDMTTDANRLTYTAVSNMIIGLVLVLGLGLGVVSHIAGPAFTLAVCAALSIVGAAVALKLKRLETAGT
ncbi:MFS transporter [Aliiroseovarius sp. PTFE2010]|uniref:MFS transporter n=1 Tax=Aliiroseovarius sp. PTFE2010 TaxID=3417190 RepID=UPI003CECFA36